MPKDQGLVAQDKCTPHADQRPAAQFTITAGGRSALAASLAQSTPPPIKPTAPPTPPPIKPTAPPTPTPEGLATATPASNPSNSPSSTSASRPSAEPTSQPALLPAAGGLISDRALDAQTGVLQAKAGDVVLPALTAVEWLFAGGVLVVVGLILCSRGRGRP